MAIEIRGIIITAMQTTMVLWMTNLRSHSAVNRRDNYISTLVGYASEDCGLVKFASAAQSAKWRKHGGVVKLVGENRHNDHYYRQ